MSLFPPFRDFAYRPAGNWPPVAATAFIIVLFIFAILAAATIFAGLQSAGLQASSEGAAILQLAMLQAVVIGGVLAAVAWRGGGLQENLALVRPAGRVPSIYVMAFLTMVVLVSVYTFAVWLIWPSVLLDDLRPFAKLMRSEWSLLAMLAVAIGAPVSEELAFRGFLFSALANSRVGLSGAALLTTIAWAALHAGYSVAGLVEVFLIGLFFSWLLVKTGSLWVPLVCHAVYNGTIMLVLKYAPVPI